MVAVYYQGNAVQGPINVLPPGSDLDVAVASSFLGFTTRRRRFGGTSWREQMAMKKVMGDGRVEMSTFVDVPRYSYGIIMMYPGECIRLLNFVDDFNIDTSVATLRCRVWVDGVVGDGQAHMNDFPADWYGDREAPTTLIGLAICRAVLNAVVDMTEEQHAAHLERVLSTYAAG